MKWYKEYLTAFEKDFDTISTETIVQVKENLAHKQSDKPLASVVVIAHNDESRLFSCLWSLANNVCNYPIEIIGVNNNSEDRTSGVFEAVGIISFFEEQKSCGYARRCGLENARGKYYICIDSDTIYPPDYIQIVIDNLQKKNIIAVSTLWSFIPQENYSKFGLALYGLMRNMHLRLLSIKRPELSVRGMVFAYEADYGRKVGYRVDIKRGEDGSMALGLKEYGRIKLITARKARAITATNTIKNDGSLFDNFRKKTLTALRSSGAYFSKKSKYEDHPSNMIKK